MYWKDLSAANDISLRHMYWKDLSAANVISLCHMYWKDISSQFTGDILQDTST